MSPFPCTQADGVPFDWSVLYGKRVLLLCDGLGCMGKTGRAYLDSLYAATSRENFLIVVYCLSGSLDELQKNRLVMEVIIFMFPILNGIRAR